MQTKITPAPVTHGCSGTHKFTPKIIHGRPVVASITSYLEDLYLGKPDRGYAPSWVKEEN